MTQKRPIFDRNAWTIAQKTKTMCFNVPPETKVINSLIKMKEKRIENVQTFTYLGHTISNDVQHQSTFTIQRIASAHKKWNELKTVLTNHQIKLSTRVKFLTACVRSRLTYSIQACNLNVSQLSKLEVTWMNFLRKLVRNGFQRVNIPSAKCQGNQPPTADDDDLDWRFKLTNLDVLRLTRSSPITYFSQTQHLKFIAHITRLPNSSLQKQVLFRSNKKPYARDCWKTYEKITGLSSIQLQREMQDRTGFPPMLGTLLGTQPTATVEGEKR